MEARWIRLCGEHADRGTVATLYGVIDALYRRDGHHTLRHVIECLDLYAQADADEPEALEFAIWLHDSVYVPGRTDNEERSLLIANMMLNELGKRWLVGPVWELIRATRDHLAESGDAALMADIDLSVLGSGRARYDEYASHIRQEFFFVPDDQYRSGRTRILNGFLARRAIFSTALCENLETMARENMAREIEALTK